MTTEQVVVNKTQWPDSQEWGTPSSGAWKAYYNVGDKEEAEIRIRHAIDLFLLGKKLNKVARE